MHQYGLDYLWNSLTSSASKQVWKDICAVASDVLTAKFPRYAEMKRSENEVQDANSEVDSRRRNLGIPKILGLDFVVGEADRSGIYKPWLVEVNRFPGLEPRDELDRIIKYQVVRDAWKKASDRVDSESCRRVVDAFVEPIVDANVDTSLHMLHRDTQ